MPSTNVDFWSAKFKGNIDRDRRNVESLLSNGWRVGIIWECVIGKSPDDVLLDSVSRFVRITELKLGVFE